MRNRNNEKGKESPAEERPERPKEVSAPKTTENRDMISILLNATTDPAFLVDRDGVVVAVNATGAQDSGKGTDEITGSCIFDLVPLPSRKRHESLLARVVHTGQPVRFHGVKKGEFDVSMYPVFGAEGRVTRLLVVYRNTTELNGADHRLRHIEDGFRTAIEYSNDGVVIMQGDRHVYVNRKFFEMLGYESVEEIIGKTHYLTVHPDDRERVTDFNRKRQGHDEAPAKYEFRAIRKDGSVIYIEASSASITYLGKPASLAYLRDITERKKTEALLAESEKRYRNLVENALVGVYQTTLDGDILYANETCLRILGFTALEEIKSGGVRAFYPNRRDRGAFLSLLKQTGKVDSYEAQFVNKTGESVPVLLNATVESDIITSMIMDLTAYKRKTLALQESKARYRILAENVSDVILTMDMNLNFTFISPSVEQLRGAAADQAPIRTLRDALTPSSYDTVMTAFRDELAKGDKEQNEPFGFRALELEYIRCDRSTRWVEAKASFLRDAGDRPTGILAVVRDITHRKEAEKELAMKSLRLEEVNTALKVLLEQRERDKTEVEENILFNVKNLISPYVDSLKRRHLDAEQRAYLDVLETNLNNIISPFAKRLTSLHERLTPAEIRVADFIRDGKSVKEIAEMFGVSENAINVHRQHIRNKLGLTNRKINLRTHLLSITK